MPIEEPKTTITTKRLEGLLKTEAQFDLLTEVMFKCAYYNKYSKKLNFNDDTVNMILSCFFPNYYNDVLEKLRKEAEEKGE